MIKKFLYLDIDGILNNTQVMLNNYGEGGYKKYQEMVKEQSSKTMALEQHTLDHIIELDWKLCLALQHLLDKYHITDIIICSTWRKVYDRDQLKLLFLAKGFPEIADKITDITSRSYDDERLVEIQKDAQLRVRKNDVIFILDDAVMCEFKSTFAFKDVKIDQYNLLSKFEMFKCSVRHYCIREIAYDMCQMLGLYKDEDITETLKKYRTNKGGSNGNMLDMS